MANSTTLKWLVFGPGAIAGVIAHQLLQQHQQLALLPHQVTSAKTIDWQLTQDNIKHHHRSEVFNGQWQPDAVIIAVKSYQLNQAVARLETLGIAANCPTIISHNGIVDIPSARPLFPLITTQAAYRQERHIIHSGSGQSWLSTRDKRSPAALPDAVIEVLSRALEPLMATAQIEHYQWQKLLINCVVNPLTACANITNGELQQPQWQPQITALIKEFVAVARASGINLDEQHAQATVSQVIQRTGTNTSSMLADIRQQQPTEIEALNGFLVRQAERVGKAVPTHRAITEQVRRLSDN